MTKSGHTDNNAGTDTDAVTGTGAVTVADTVAAAADAIVAYSPPPPSFAFRRSPKVPRPWLADSFR